MTIQVVKGLEKYLQIHGCHFTKELACATVSSKWSVDSVLKNAQKLVYYNVTESTAGDMYYMTNWLYNHDGWPEAHDENSSIKIMLWMIGNYSLGSSYFFCDWLWNKRKQKEDFDFTPYT